MSKENEEEKDLFGNLSKEILEKLGIDDKMKLDMLKSSPIKLFEMTAKSVMNSLKTFQRLYDDGKMDEKEYKQLSAELSATMAYSMIILKNSLAIQWIVLDEDSKQIISPIALNPMAKDKMPLIVKTMLNSASELVSNTLITDPNYGKGPSVDEMLEELKKIHNPFKT